MYVHTSLFKQVTLECAQYVLMTTNVSTQNSYWLTVKFANLITYVALSGIELNISIRDRLEARVQSAKPYTVLCNRIIYSQSRSRRHHPIHIIHNRWRYARYICIVSRLKIIYGEIYGARVKNMNYIRVLYLNRMF